MQGITDWNRAFERAGFKDAVRALVPDDTLDVNSDDLSYSVLTYAASEKANAMGPSTIDPRTGYPVQHSLLSATVVSSSCMRADALATACMVLGEEEGLAMIARAQDAACYFIVAQNDSLITITSPQWDDFIR